MSRSTCYAVTVAAVVAIAGCAADVEPVNVVIGQPGGSGSGSGSGTGSGSGIGEPGNLPPVTISLTISDRPLDPSPFGFFVAYRNGSGAWQLAPEPTGDIYSFEVTSRTWSAAWGCKVGTSKQWSIELAMFATAERTSFIRGINRGCTDRQLAPLSSLAGTVTNLPSTGTGWAATYGGSSVGVTRVNTTSGAFDFTNSVRAGNRDLVAYHTVDTTEPEGDYVDAAAIVRYVTAPTTSAVVNWTAAGVQSATITATNTTGTLSATTDLYTKTNTHVNLAFQTSHITGTSMFKSPSLPAAQMVSGDVYVQTVFSSLSGSALTQEVWSSTIGSRSFATPAALGALVSSVSATTPYARVTSQWPAYPAAVGYAVLTQQSLADSSLRVWNATIGAGYLDATPTFELPDLSALPGWDPEFGFKVGTAITGSVAALTSSAGVSDLPYTYPAPSGTQRTRASQAYRVMP